MSPDEKAHNSASLQEALKKVRELLERAERELGQQAPMTPDELDRAKMETHDLPRRRASGAD